MAAETRGGLRWDRHPQLIRILERFTVKHGIPPTTREVAAALKVSEQAARARLARARGRGFVVRRANGEDETGSPAWRWYVTAAGRELLK
jgi:predicted ArsR family transcriptional regulator